MKLPIQAQPVIRNVSAANHMNALDNGIIASDCPWYKQWGCEAAIAACAIACGAGVVPACVSCLVAIGQGNCIDCVLSTPSG